MRQGMVPADEGGGMMAMDTGDTIATYAAVVGTLALGLEVVRWLRERPKIVIQTLAGYASDGSYEILVTVSNRGAVPTTVTGAAIMEYGGLIDVWRRSPAQDGTGYLLEQTAPILLGQNEQDTRSHRISREHINLRSGRFWLVLMTTDRDRTYVRHIKAS